MRRYWAYMKYVMRHKWFVLQEGLKIGVPFWMLILHDWDKFLPDEWVPYARTFYTRSGQKQYLETHSFTSAWARHQWRNKHHWQYWVRILRRPLKEYDTMMMDRGTLLTFNGEKWEPTGAAADFALSVTEMPEVYRREMIADWRGAGRAGKSMMTTLEWYSANRQFMVLGKETRAWIEKELGYEPEEDPRDTREFPFRFHIGYRADPPPPVF
jgi:hypothetical protein